jgi:RNA polymerase sigma-70 factor (ECF subfamily)
VGSLKPPLGRPRLSREQSEEVQELYVQEARDLYRYACSLPLAGGCRPEDLVQTTFHEAILGWEKVSQYALDERRKWLRRVLKNKAIDDWRKNCAVDLTGAVPEPGPQPAGPSELAELSIALENCWTEIKQMPPVRQKVAFLVWNEFWTTERIADHLGVAPSTVRGHLREARRQLRSSVGHLVPFFDEEEDDKGREPAP